MMGRQLADEDSLFKAIDELRLSVDRLIDEQTLRLNVLDREKPAMIGPDARMPRISALANPRPAAPACNRPSKAPERFPSTPERTPDGPPAKGPADQAEDNPRQRLDALARHLDDCLRRAGQRPAT